MDIDKRLQVYKQTRKGLTPKQRKRLQEKLNRELSIKRVNERINKHAQS